jgi:hypothetical protein
MVGGPAELVLDALEFGEQIQRRKGTVQFDGGIEERRGTGRAVLRFGFVNAGTKKRAGAIVQSEEVAAGFAEAGGAVPEVGTERNASPHFRPRTSCMS